MIAIEMKVTIFPAELRFGRKTLSSNISEKSNYVIKIASKIGSEM